jgi:hypothetical protein
MDNDAVRTSADRTLVDMWIDGKSRTVSVSRAAIEAHLRLSPERAASMSDEDRREFVRGNLRLVQSAATDFVRAGNADALRVDIEQLSGNAPPAPSDRRQGDRRKGGDRRKSNLGPPPSGERRRGSRDQRGA